MDSEVVKAFRDLTVVELEDNALFTIMHVFEVADGGSGPDTIVLLRRGETGEVRQELLSTLRDPDFYKLFAMLGQAKEWIEKQT